VRYFFYYFSYLSIRLLGGFLSLLPSPLLLGMSKGIGSLVFILHRPFRKKALANLAIAYGDQLPEKQRRQIARRSFQHLVMTCLEFFTLEKCKGHYQNLVEHKNSETLLNLQNKRQGVVLFCGHQANWEIPFLAFTEKFPGGVAIGRSVKNPFLYRWVVSLREINGAKMLLPKNAMRYGTEALKKGAYVGIVGDQAHPQSSYSYPLFGTRAWTSTAPALLACRTNCPIIVSSTKRKGTKLYVELSDPIWPNPEKPIKEEVPRLMNEVLGFFEKKIREDPQQWMWVHDRWKQHGIDHVKREYRFGFACLIFSDCSEESIKAAQMARKIYHRSFITLYAPEGFQVPEGIEEVHTYKNQSELFIRDWRQQIVLDFSKNKKLQSHYKWLGAFHALDIKKEQNKRNLSLEQTLKQVIVKKECQTTVTF
jgi:Kdo2-lipid IVA lauroyltransferase/acyltransferase